jgi:hypothetical protein
MVSTITVIITFMLTVMIAFIFTIVIAVVLPAVMVITAVFITIMSTVMVLVVPVAECKVGGGGLRMPGDPAQACEKANAQYSEKWYKTLHGLLLFILDTPKNLDPRTFLPASCKENPRVEDDFGCALQ